MKVKDLIPILLYYNKVVIYDHIDINDEEHEYFEQGFDFRYSGFVKDIPLEFYERIVETIEPSIFRGAVLEERAMDIILQWS